MTADKINKTIKLKDGRALGYAEYGAPDGKPILPPQVLTQRLAKRTLFPNWMNFSNPSYKIRFRIECLRG